jgi:uncharacterized protein YdhG (YjbR/CyaY superfamily)
MDTKSPNLPYGKVKFQSIDEYHATFSGMVREKLEEIKSIIKEVLPEGKEVISYNMPAFKMNKVLVYYAGYKSHIGFYPTPSPIKLFEKELLKFKTSKGAIQFHLDEPLPKLLIQKITIYRLQQEQEAILKNKKS